MKVWIRVAAGSNINDENDGFGDTVLSVNSIFIIEQNVTKS